MTDFLAGAVAMASWVAGLIFLRFHGRTQDRIFLFFAASFWLDAVGRTLEVALRWTDDGSPGVYVLRVIAYGLILAGILDKNRARER
ncbi:DUF5985 family protein [Tahibacter caeni]|uniref:DUF5985 family protein n=1 Tax=Tahibacter caeni TaxID=1453545 RepID=UPI0021480AA6|nr:DUF5985 family protein [Tahibacter caeni]